MTLPPISVVIPTFRRPELLRRAVNSVFAQTERDWELIVSDDEETAGASWGWLTGLAASDRRVRLVRNPGPHGQVGNTNAALRAARGTWIKLLHDDDVLKSDCLAVLKRAVAARPDVVAVSCADEGYFDGRCVDPFRRRGRPLLEEIGSGEALLAMYLLDEGAWARPSQQFIHRSLIDAGVLFEQPHGTDALVDSWWNARTRARGPSLIYNEALVEWHMGPHPTITNLRQRKDEFDQEFVLFRRLIRPLVPEELDPPRLEAVERMVRIARALTHLRDLHVGETIALARNASHPEAAGLALQWVLRQFAPRRFSRIARQVIWP